MPTGHAVVVSTKPRYSGFVHTVASAIWASKFGVSKPYIFVVGEDVDVTDPEEVLWCLTTRLHPDRGIHVQKAAPAGPLTPFLSREEKASGSGSRVLFDATFPYHWPAEERPTVIDFEHAWPLEVRGKVLARWEEYGI